MKKSLKKSKLVADLDASLLSLKHTISNNVKSVSASVPSRDLLTEIGMNVLRRAQDVRDSLVKSVFQKSKRKRKVSVKAAKAAAPNFSSKKTKTSASKRKPTAKKSSTRKQTKKK